MYRISVSTLEKFRRCMDGVSARDTEEELLQTIKGVFEGNDMTRVGGAYHQIIEQQAIVAQGGLIGESDGHRIFFTAEQAEPAIEFKRAHISMIHEIPGKKQYQTRIGPVMVTFRLDGLEGLHVRDTKCKFGPLDMSEYADSYQWRYYLDGMALDLFYYDFFQFLGFNGLEGPMPYLLGGVMVAGAQSLELARYDRLHQDCEQLLEEFLDYIAFRKLFNFLKTTEGGVAC